MSSIGLPQGLPEDEHGSLELLADVVDRLRQASDLDGLIRVQNSVLELAASSRGRQRRKAARIARKVGGAINDLRRVGVETALERQEREAAADREARRRQNEAEAMLRKRFAATLKLVFHDREEGAGSVARLRSLISPEREDRIVVALPRAGDPAWPRFISAYDRGLEIFQAIYGKPKTKDGEVIAQTLRAIGVDLLSHGAELRDLSTDAIPLIAYSLYNNRLPVAPEADSPETADKIHEMLLRTADEASETSAASRAVFLGLMRLAILLAEAQAYGTAAGVATL